MRLFTTSKTELVRQLVGENTNEHEVKDLSAIIDKSIGPIIDFFSKDTVNSILLIDSKWGTGKTTATLIAINEIKKPEIIKTNRYIYESVFRYKSSIDEFMKDLFGTLFSVTFELGINIQSDANNLIRNFSFSPQKTIENFIRSDPAEEKLTIELAHKINEDYRTKEIKSTIFIILDDLDRLQGKDILRVLSVLSLLRHLNFVKIVIPADLSIITKALKVIGVQEPEIFVKKYLPEQFSVRIDFGYAAAENAIAMAMRKKLPNEDSRPIWAAILIAMISEVLRNETLFLSDHRGNWLTIMYSGEAENVGWTTRRILCSAPDYMASKTNGALSMQQHSGKLYYWEPKYNSIQNFENILWALRFRENNKPVCKSFSLKEYDTLVEPWIFYHAKVHWDEFGLTIRTALDFLNIVKQDLNNAPESKEQQFALAFNKFFPSKQIEISKNSAAE